MYACSIIYEIQIKKHKQITMNTVETYSHRFTLFLVIYKHLKRWGAQELIREQFQYSSQKVTRSKLQINISLTGIFEL